MDTCVAVALFEGLPVAVRIALRVEVIVCDRLPAELPDLLKVIDLLSVAVLLDVFREVTVSSIVLVGVGAALDVAETLTESVPASVAVLLRVPVGLPEAVRIVFDLLVVRVATSEGDPVSEEVPVRKLLLSLSVMVLLRLDVGIGVEDWVLEELSVPERTALVVAVNVEVCVGTEL